MNQALRPGSGIPSDVKNADLAQAHASRRAAERGIGLSVAVEDDVPERREGALEALGESGVEAGDRHAGV